MMSSIYENASDSPFRGIVRDIAVRSEVHIFIPHSISSFFSVLANSLFSLKKFHYLKMRKIVQCIGVAMKKRASIL